MEAWHWKAGGPAFPVASQFASDRHRGMTLHDYYVGQFTAALIQANGTVIFNSRDVALLIGTARTLADEALRQRTANGGA